MDTKEEVDEVGASRRLAGGVAFEWDVRPRFWGLKLGEPVEAVEPFDVFILSETRGRESVGVQRGGFRFKDVEELVEEVLEWRWGFVVNLKEMLEVVSEERDDTDDAEEYPETVSRSLNSLESMSSPR